MDREEQDFDQRGGITTGTAIWSRESKVQGGSEKVFGSEC